MKKIFFRAIVGLLILGILNIEISQALGGFNFSNTNIWETLFKVKWYRKYSKEFKVEIDYPDFTPEIKALSGKEIIISGYIVPVDMYGGDGTYFILSAYPASSCFFCGAAGPESVIEVYPLKKRVFQGNSKLTIKGKLKLNPDNPDHLIYILEEAVQHFE